MNEAILFTMFIVSLYKSKAQKNKEISDTQQFRKVISQVPFPDGILLEFVVQQIKQSRQKEEDVRSRERRIQYERQVKGDSDCRMTLMRGERVAQKITNRLRMCLSICSKSARHLIGLLEYLGKVSNRSKKSKSIFYENNFEFFHSIKILF